MCCFLGGGGVGAGLVGVCTLLVVPREHGRTDDGEEDDDTPIPTTTTTKHAIAERPIHTTYNQVNQVKRTDDGEEDAREGAGGAKHAHQVPLWALAQHLGELFLCFVVVCVCGGYIMGVDMNKYMYVCIYIYILGRHRQPSHAVSSLSPSYLSHAPLPRTHHADDGGVPDGVPRGVHEEDGHVKPVAFWGISVCVYY